MDTRRSGETQRHQHRMGAGRFGSRYQARPALMMVNAARTTGFVLASPRHRHFRPGEDKGQAPS